MPNVSGYLRKMKTAHDSKTNEVSYQLNLDDEAVLDMNSLIGQTISLTHNGEKQCVHCGNSIKKTFQGGYCYPCFQSLAECDRCIMKPSECHFELGTCRDEDWAQGHCFIEHTLYLARSSGIKVGITRSNQQIHRWMDQGANEALVIGSYENRRLVGLAELQISQAMSDKTNWRKMLKNDVTEEPFDEYIQSAYDMMDDQAKEGFLEDGERFEFKYPVTEWPEKVVSKSFDKVPERKSKLVGIKGQYLIFDDHVTNLRSHAGYHLKLDC